MSFEKPQNFIMSLPEEVVGVAQQEEEDGEGLRGNHLIKDIDR